MRCVAPHSCPSEPPTKARSSPRCRRPQCRSPRPSSADGRSRRRRTMIRHRRRPSRSSLCNSPRRGHGRSRRGRGSGCLTGTCLRLVGGQGRHGDEVLGAGRRVLRQFRRDSQPVGRRIDDHPGGAAGAIERRQCVVASHARPHCAISALSRPASATGPVAKPSPAKPAASTPQEKQRRPPRASGVSLHAQCPRCVLVLVRALRRRADATAPPRSQSLQPYTRRARRSRSTARGGFRL